MKNILSVDLNAIRQNALSIKKALSGKTKLCAVLKADAYGHGAAEVANELYSVCDCFAVALTEEGEELRLSGIDKDILLLIPPTDKEAVKVAQLGLIFTAESVRDLIRYDKAAKKAGVCARVHIKYNTGMNRLGADGLKELSDMAEASLNLKHLRIEGLYSHFACPEKNTERKKAINKFLLAIKLVKGYNKNVICHLSASGGFLKGDADFDMVRIGLLLYGYKPFGGRRVKVKKAMSLSVPIIKKRTVKKGESAMYGNMPFKKDKEISVVRFGYADGLPRKIVKGQYNYKCMDVTALTGKRGKIYRITDMAELAKKHNTVPYEILTEIGIRAEKIYTRRKK